MTLYNTFLIAETMGTVPYLDIIIEYGVTVLILGLAVAVSMRIVNRFIDTEKKMMDSLLSMVQDSLNSIKSSVLKAQIMITDHNKKVGDELDKIKKRIDSLDIPRKYIEDEKDGD